LLANLRHPHGLSGAEPVTGTITSKPVGVPTGASILPAYTLADAVVCATPGPPIIAAAFGRRGSCLDDARTAAPAAGLAPDIRPRPTAAT
jgi:hypothetical protein